MRKKRAYRNLTLLVAAGLSLLYTSFHRIAPSSSARNVLDVIDGDTIKLAGNLSMRYIGIDTPEVGERQNGAYRYNPQPFALEAKELNKALVEGKQIRIEYDVTKKDSYGRLLGYCFVKDQAGNETFVNEKILEEGLGFVFTYPPNVKYTDRFVQAQEKARRQKKGIWGADVPADASRAADWVGKTTCIRGTVASCYNSGKAYFLNFYPASQSVSAQEKGPRFTTVIFAKDAVSFQQKNIPPCSYVAKPVEVVGKVKRYKEQIEIIVRDPSQITIVSEKQE